VGKVENLYLRTDNSAKEITDALEEWRKRASQDQKPKRKRRRRYWRQPFREQTLRQAWNR
jgi:hypothetical protein